MGTRTFVNERSGFSAVQKSSAGGTQRGYSFDPDCGRAGSVWLDHAVFGLIRFLLQRIWFFNLYVRAPGEMAGAGDCCWPLYFRSLIITTGAGVVLFAMLGTIGLVGDSFVRQ